MTVEYLPSRGTIWRWTLLRTFWYPERRWARLLTGPALAGLGLAMIGGAGPFAAAGWGLMGGALVGIGLVWTAWPPLGAFVAVTRSGKVRARTPIRLTLVGQVLELVRDEDRVLFALEDLVGVHRAFGETFAIFRGERAVLLPRRATSGDAEGLLRLLLQAAPPT